ncbi:MAG: lysophospholipid acyltransferase family protein [Betaproteobacteria bacterium]
MFEIVPASYARRGGGLSRVVGRMLFKLAGWHFEGELPDVPKLVIAVAPHTTNWDFVIGVVVLWSLDIKISFLGKHTLFRGWFGRWMRSIGGIPVDRSHAHGVVGESVAAFSRVDRLVLAIAPEGTRQLDKGFKTGFLHIAHTAKVPVLLAYFDFSRKVVGFGPLLVTSGDVERDMNQILDFYRPIRGKYRKDWQVAPQ